MKHLSIALLFTLLLSGTAHAGYVRNPDATFTVGVTHVDKYGNGKRALILIPGLTDSAAVWQGTIGHFAGEDTIYAVTLAGFGGVPTAKAPLVTKAIADIAVLIRKEHLQKPVLIGHSLGGFTAIRFAEEHSDLIAGAIAVEGLPILPGFDKMTPAQRAAAGARMTGPMAAASSTQFDAFERANVIPYLTKAANVSDVAAAGAGANPPAAAEYMTELLTTDLRPKLNRVRVPLEEIVPFDASLDPFNPQAPFKTAAGKLAYYQALLANDKTATVVPIEDSRHFVMFDQPEAFYAAVQTFLNALPAR